MNNSLWKKVALGTAVAFGGFAVQAAPAQAIVLDKFQQPDSRQEAATSDGTATDETTITSPGFGIDFDRTLTAEETTGNGQLTTSVDPDAVGGSGVFQVAAEPDADGTGGLTYTPTNQSSFDLTQGGNDFLRITLSRVNEPVSDLTLTLTDNNSASESVSLADNETGAVDFDVTSGNFSSLDTTDITEVDYSFSIADSGDIQASSVETVPFEAETSFGLIAVAGFFGYRKFRQYKAKRQNDSVGA